MIYELSLMIRISSIAMLSLWLRARLKYCEHYECVTTLTVYSPGRRLPSTQTGMPSSPLRVNDVESGRPRLRRMPFLMAGASDRRENLTLTATPSPSFFTVGDDHKDIGR